MRLTQDSRFIVLRTVPNGVPSVVDVFDRHEEPVATYKERYVHDDRLNTVITFVSTAEVAGSDTKSYVVRRPDATLRVTGEELAYLRRMLAGRRECEERDTLLGKVREVSNDTPKTLVVKSR